ncbi:hypothetical protein K440DRAFT_636555 [Wilcoxina mikolae CBS 423.85]|nr:hypothetical protein K440DRAFT_636555 [Wilcoxina mikolae CBS 423.85]
MVTGVETAGLVLAAFPILIQFLDFYNGGVQKATELRNYRRVLKRLVRELKMEKCKFGNTCENLLDGMPSVSAEEAKSLIEGKGWEDAEFQAKLEKHLGPRSAGAFTEAVEAMNLSLEGLSEKIGLHGQSMHVLKQLKIAFQQEYFVTVLIEINKINADLALVTNQRAQTTGAAIQSHEQRSRTAEHYNRIRTHARSLYGVFEDRFRNALCPCNPPHNASLRLRRVPMNRAEDRRLGVLFDSDSHACALEFDHESLAITCESKLCPIEDAFRSNSQAGSRFVNFIDSIKQAAKPKRSVSFRDLSNETAISEEQQFPTPQISTDTATIANPKQIEDLCAAIKQAASGRSVTTCIGVLIDECNGLRHLHRIWLPTPRPPLSTYLRETVSLETLLTMQCVEKKERLELGVQLASAVMQLHKSEWLGEAWGKQDIFFFQRSNCRLETASGQWVPAPVIDQPFVRRRFPNPQGSTPGGDCSISTLIPYDKSLFSLGIVLVELWFGKCIEDLKGSRSTALDENAAYETARGYIGEVFTAAGEAYGLAVSRCLGSMEGSMKSLEDVTFKNKAHSGIVCLLEKNFEAFAGISY